MQTVVNLRTGERRRLAEYVGCEEGEPIGGGVAGRFSWQFVGDSVRWGRHELERCATGNADLLVVDQIGPLELVAGSGWSNAVDALLKARFGLALVVVNPLVLEELRRCIGDWRPVDVEANDATRDLLPEYIVAFGGWSTVPGHPLLGTDGPDCLAADLDGTLLEANDRPASGIVAALRETSTAGVCCAVCTGRPTDYAFAAAHSLGVERGYIIAYGGAETRDLAGGAPLQHVPMTGDAPATVGDIARTLALQVTPHGSPAGTLRLVLAGGVRQIEHAVMAINEALGDSVSLLRPASCVLAVQDAAATKQAALASLAVRIGVDRAAIAYLGDAVDDAAALRWAGLGIAVAGDAPQVEAQAAADVVAPRRLVPEMLTRLALARRLRGAG